MTRTMKLAAVAMVSVMSAKLLAQTVQPVIAEYKGRGEGKIAVTNDSLSPMVVLLEPMSFDITSEGRGIYRPLDKWIHVELSTTSVRLAPKQTAYVFYKAESEVLPAWFTVYATFSRPQHSSNLDVRIMLPHTVYLYQRDPIQPGDVQIVGTKYLPQEHKLVAEVVNFSKTLGRVQSFKVSSEHESLEGNGFPMLPGGWRQVEMDWTGKEPPREVDFQFEHFYTKELVIVDK